MSKILSLVPVCEILLQQKRNNFIYLAAALYFFHEFLSLLLLLFRISLTSLCVSYVCTFVCVCVFLIFLFSVGFLHLTNICAVVAVEENGTIRKMVSREISDRIWSTNSKWTSSSSSSSLSACSFCFLSVFLDVEYFTKV